MSASEVLHDNNRSHFVQISEELCNGCVLCMRSCPMKAIRVRHGIARIEGECIDCGECIRICPRGAIKALTTGRDVTKIGPHAIMIVSPVLYSQFGEDVMPEEIFSALRMIFRHVYDQAYAHELFNLAAEIYMNENREKKENVWPLISPVCPVVNRLIAHRFPSLLRHVLPIITPREIVARDIRKRFDQEGSSKREEIGVYQITSCSAKMICIKDPMFLDSSYLDGAVGINEVYDLVKKSLHRRVEDMMLLRSSGVGIGWVISGGEIAGLGEGNYLAVSGIQETIRYLEKIEMGLISNIEYYEFRACLEGCIGGPMTVADRYEAKRILQRRARMFGPGKRVKYMQALRAYEGGCLSTHKIAIPTLSKERHLSVSEAIRRQEKVEHVLGMLPGKECGLCGSPSCRTFAEDVADGRSLLEDCIFIKYKTKNGEMK